MFKFGQALKISSLLAGLVWLLVACGGDNINLPPSSQPADPVSIMKTLEQHLNQGKVSQALELFGEEPVLLQVHTDRTSGYYTPGGYYIPRAYSVETSERLFKGQDEVNSYFFQLLERQFQTSNSRYSEDEGGVSWRFLAPEQMEFKATIEAGKIKTLIVSLS